MSSVPAVEGLSVWSVVESGLMARSTMPTAAVTLKRRFILAAVNPRNFNLREEQLQEASGALYLKPKSNTLRPKPEL